MVTSNLPFQEWTGGFRLGTADRRPARSPYPSYPHAGDERRQLPSQAEPPQVQLLNRPIRTRRARRISSATRQRLLPLAYSATSRSPTGLPLLRHSGLLLFRFWHAGRHERELVVTVAPVRHD